MRGFVREGANGDGGEIGEREMAVSGDFGGVEVVFEAKERFVRENQNSLLFNVHFVDRDDNPSMSDDFVFLKKRRGRRLFKEGSTLFNGVILRFVPQASLLQHILF